MSSIFLTTLSGFILFIMGCYLGYQVGSTRHIREKLARIRTNDRK